MASILKPDSLSKQTGAPVPIAFNIEDVHERAQQYLAVVQQEAKDLLKQAAAEAQQIRDAAYQEGLQNAQTEIDRRVEAQATQLSDARCRTAVAACESTLSKVTQETGDWLTQWRDQTVHLAAQIAEKLVRHEMSTETNELLRVWLEEALVSLRDTRELRILVHPDDFAVTGRFLKSLAKSIPHVASAEVLPDPEVEQGGCIIRTAHGQIDVQLSAQLARLAEQLS